MKSYGSNNLLPRAMDVAGSLHEEVGGRTEEGPATVGMWR
jgi:hypothetical protein